MVKGNSTLDPDPLKYTSIALSEVVSNSTRLEAIAFNLEVKAAKYKVEHCKYGFVHLWGTDGLVKEAYYGNRTKREYVSKNTVGAIGFIGSSEMLEINPKPNKYLSSNGKRIDDFRVSLGSVLISRSGTIGNVSFVNKTLSKLLVSEHAIRIIPINFGGYIYAFLKSSIGKTMVKANTFGAVVDEIEPEHLKNIIIPNAPDLIKKQIHDLVVESYDLRDRSNELIDEAERILYEELQLPPIEQLKPKYFDTSVDLRNYISKLSRLDLRLDCSYHTPIVNEIINVLNSNSKQLVSLGTITNGIVLPGRFSRTYVGSNNGVQFLGGKDLFNLNPISEKYLSRTIHKKQIDGELKITKNNILTPSRGTIGAVALAPKHFEDKVISDNIINIRVIDNMAGYVFSFLNTDYGCELIKRHIYGGVVDAMEPSMLYNVEIPILKDEPKQKEINDKVLQANVLRHKAYLKEEEALRMMEEVIDNNNKLY